MIIIKRVYFIASIFFIISFISPTFTQKKDNDKSKKLPDSAKEEPIKTEILELFEKAKDKASENEEEKVEIPPDEIENLKEKEYELAVELAKKEGKPEISHETFDKIWNEKQKEYGKHFNSIAGKMLFALKEAADKINPEENSEEKIRQLFDKAKDKAYENEEEKVEIPPDEMEKLKEKEYELANELAKKEGKPEISHETFDKVWDEKKKEYGKHFDSIARKMQVALKEAAEKIDRDENSEAEIRQLFEKTKEKIPEGEEGEVEISSDEMEKVKEEEYELANAIITKEGKAEVSHEAFDKVWNEKKKEYGKHFNLFAGKMLVALKEAAEKIEPTTLEASEAPSVTTIQTSGDVSKEKAPEDTYALRNAKGKICILAKFLSSITITYPGNSAEQKVEVTIPHSNHTHIKGKCKGSNGSSSLQILWGKFIFSLFFNKTSDDTWVATLVELTYDTSERLFDGAAKRESITVKNKKANLFETPIGKSYFCPAQEVILLYREEQLMATVRLKEIHIQPYDVDGKFSTLHRCNQVVIGDEEEPFVQDETVPLAVGCTLALITLLILVGFSVHRAYNAAKVDYNTVE